jgi:hypothetical protein
MCWNNRNTPNFALSLWPCSNLHGRILIAPATVKDTRYIYWRRQRLAMFDDAATRLYVFDMVETTGAL